MINKLLEDTIYSNLFPKQIILKDDQSEFIFSIETYNGGTNRAFNKNFLSLVLDQYIDFQKAINKHEPSLSVSSYSSQIIKTLDLSNKDQSLLNKYFDKLKINSESQLSPIDQHGDLTPDNIFIRNGHIKIIDCDRFGDVRLAGYDLYRFVMRVDPKNLEKYLNKYFYSLKLQNKSNKALLFLYYLHDLLFKKERLSTKSALSIINEFESIHKLIKSS